MSSDGGATFQDTAAGRYTAQFDGGPIADVYCVDLTHEVVTGGQYEADTQYAITDPSGSLTNGYHQGGLASALIDGDFTSISVAEAQKRSSEVAFLADAFLYDYNYSSLDERDTNQAAVGLSIWDIVQDGGDGLSAGQMQASPADTALYGPLVSEIEGYAATYYSSYQSSTAVWVQAPSQTLGNHEQDFVYLPSDVPAAVPEASTTVSLGLLLMLGLGGMTVAAKRKQGAAA